MNDLDKSLEVFNNVPEGWEPLFKTAENEIKTTLQTVSKSQNITPPLSTVFALYYKIKPQDMKVLIVMDEPNETAVNGYDIPMYSREFRNIEQRLQESQNSTFYLDRWIEQGVGVTYVSLTKGGHPHWAGFLCHQMKFIDKVNPKVIYLLWGDIAKSMRKFCKKQTAFICGSPTRYQTNFNGFGGMDHFDEVNILLEKRGEDPIEW